MLRTPNSGNANNVRICNTGNGGALNNNNAVNSNGAAPIERTYVSFKYRKGKQCISRKELISRLQKGAKRLRTAASCGMIRLFAAVFL